MRESSSLLCVFRKKKKHTHLLDTLRLFNQMSVFHLSHGFRILSTLYIVHFPSLPGYWPIELSSGDAFYHCLTELQRVYFARCLCHTHTHRQWNYLLSQVYLFCPFSCFYVAKCLVLIYSTLRPWLNYTDGNISQRAWYQKNILTKHLRSYYSVQYSDGLSN